MATTAEQILAMAGQHQEILARLEDKQAQQMVQAWQQARTELAERMETLYGRAFGPGAIVEPKDVVEWTQRAEMLRAVDGRLDALGITTQTLQGQAWSAGAAAGWEQAQKELGVVAKDFGKAAVAFGKLDTLAQDLAMTAAVNETKNLGVVLRGQVHTALIAGATQGEGVSQLIKRLDPILGGATVPAGSRSELIARWAVIKGNNAAADDAYNEAAKLIPGLKKMWLVQRDERTCPHCLGHWGEVVDVGDEFDKERSFAPTPQKVYGDVLEYPPLHPRCRCTMTTWHERWRGLSTFTPETYQDQAQEAAVAAGFTAAPKPFSPPKLPKLGSLRDTRKGRRVIHSQNIAEIPDSVREATIERYLACQLGGKA